MGLTFSTLVPYSMPTLCNTIGNLMSQDNKVNSLSIFLNVKMLQELTPDYQKVLSNNKA